jgi:cardiolipin synthase
MSGDAQQFRYQIYLPVGVNVYEYQNRVNHLKIATIDERYTIIGSANLNYRSLEDDRDFEVVILIDCTQFAREINLRVRDLDISRSKRITLHDVAGPGSELWPIICRAPDTIAAEELRLI